MSTATEAIELVDNLVKAKIPKETAKQLVDYADKQKSDQVSRDAFNLLRVLMIGGFTISFVIMGFLFTYIDKRFDRMEAEQREQIDKIEVEQREQRKLLLRILQKR